MNDEQEAKAMAWAIATIVGYACLMARGHHTVLEASMVAAKGGDLLVEELEKRFMQEGQED